MSDLDDILGLGGVQGILQATTKRKPEEEKPLPVTPAYKIADKLGLLDHVEKAGGNSPFLIDGAETVRLVLAGAIDLFWVDRDMDQDDPAVGKRHHLMRVDEGRVLLGLAPDFDAVSIVAVPANGTRLATCPLADYYALTSQKELMATIADGLDQWCAHLLDNIPDSYPPTNIAPVTDFKNVEISENKPLHAKDGVQWVWDSEKALTLYGHYPDQGFTLPISQQVWVQAACPTKVSSATTLLRLSAGDREAKTLLSDIQSFNTVALEIFKDALAANQWDERQRFLGHEEGETIRFNSALSSLSAILGSENHIPSKISGSPFIAACQLMAKECGITLPEKMPPEAMIEAWQDPVLGFAQYGGFFVRSIVLEGDWWRDMQMPVLTSYGEDKKTCVVLTDQKGRCLLIDPANNISQPVTDKIAREINTVAHVFYAPFPKGKLGAFTLLKFGIQGMQRSILPIIMVVILTGLLSLATPVITSWILEPIIPEAQTGQLLVMISALILAGVTTGVFSFVQSITLMRMEGLITHKVQAAVWDKLLKLPAAFFRQFSVGDLASRAQDIDSMRQLLSNSLLGSFVHGVTGLFSLGMMFYYNWKISLFLLLVLFLFTVVNYLVGKRILAHTREVLAQTGTLRGIVFQLLSAVRKIRITGSERSAFAHWASSYAPLQELSFQQKNLNNALGVVKVVFSALATITLIVTFSMEGGSILDFYYIHGSESFASHNKIMQVMSMSHFVAFHVAFGQFMAAVFGLNNLVIQLLSFKPLFERVQPILDAEEETVSNNEYAGDVIGGIEVCDIKFRYSPETDLVLKGTSFYAKPGEYIALTGPSGAGKSTLIRMLLGFDTPEAGSIFLDGKDIGKLDKRSMRRNFGVVLQNGRLLSGSIFHNITAGANLSQDEAWEAARKAGLDKDIEKMPMGMETYLGEGAASLSGGQRQRLMIARALIHKPRLMIFDEATSALDNEVQRTVMKSLDELSNTRIVVAHRLSTIINADRIYVMDQGKVVEAGSYQELMDKKGLFHEMAIRQIA